MKKLLVFPFSRLLSNGLPNPKNYPPIGDVVRMLRGPGLTTVQIGVSHDPSIGCDERINNATVEDLIHLGKTADAFLSVESFFPHLVAALDLPIKGAVIWVVTKHTQYGYPRFTNIYSGRPTDIPPQFSTMTMEQIAQAVPKLSIPRPEKIVESVKLLLTR